MSGFNQKGPMGQGSMSGRKMGKCTNFGANVKPETSVGNAQEVPLTGNQSGKGMGSGRGMGMGRQHRFRSGH